MFKKLHLNYNYVIKIYVIFRLRNLILTFLNINGLLTVFLNLTVKEQFFNNMRM